MISSILQRKLGRFIIPPGRFGEDFPPGLAFPSSLTIIPNTKEWMNTIETVKQWCFCFNRLIKSKATIAEQEHFFELQLTGGLFKRADREEIMKEIGIKPMDHLLSLDLVVEHAVYNAGALRQFKTFYSIH
ncbi:Uncharacterised protein r2_g1753 [Pycnogonum litorale]